jgi:hypothetical protein
MKTQLQALVDAGRQPNIQLQILPGDDPMNARLFGPFVITSFPTSAGTDVVHTELPTRTLYYEEEADIETTPSCSAA